MTEYTAGEKYVLHYTWTPTQGDNKGIPQKAEVSATFTGKIYVIGNIEFGEFQHDNNKKVRHLSKEMLATMSPVLDREIEAGGTW